MSGRVRTIRDLNNQNPGPNQRMLGGQPGNDYPILNSARFEGTPEDARKETFWEMLKFIFCPYFTMKSFIFVITIVDVIMYIITVSYDYDTDNFLQPRTDTLITFGAKDPARMKGYEIWRWITPTVLHANLMHLFSNMLMQVVVGFRLEPTVGVWRTMAIYELSGFGGVLFSSLVSSGVAVGASTSLFGLLSGMITWLVMNWSRLPEGPSKMFTLVWLIMLIVFNLLLGVTSSLIDNWGHFGGLITGFGVALVIFKYVDNQESQNERRARYIAGAGLAFYFILGLSLFYTEVKT
jgi:membrane associated rhomboid family serine protease